MKPAELLPKETIWRADGHASDLVLGAVADGQLDVVPALALAHVERCDLCGERLGEAVALGMVVDELAAEHALALTPERSAPPVPVRALGAVLLVAVLGTTLATGGLANIRAGLLELVRLLLIVVRALFDLVPLVVRAMGDAAFIITGFSGLLLVLMGWSIARLLPRHALKEIAG